MSERESDASHSEAGADATSLTLGLVLTLHGDSARRELLLRALAQRPDVVVAEAQGHRLPVVLETRPGEDRMAVDALTALPGVVFCDVVYAHFEDCEDAP